jgi:hypothetical protein
MMLCVKSCNGEGSLRKAKPWLFVFSLKHDLRCRISSCLNCIELSPIIA